MKNVKFCVIGLGQFGYNLAVQLSKAGAEVVAVDNHQEKIDEIADKVTLAICMDSADKTALKSLGLEEMDGVIVAIGEDFEHSIMTTAHLQELGIKKIYNRVTSKVHRRLLELMNIHELLLPESDAALQLTHRLMNPGLLDFLSLDSEHSIFEVKVPKKFIGKTLMESNLREDYELNLVTIKRKIIKHGLFKSTEVYEAIGVPKPNEIFQEGDILILFGINKNLKELMD